ncbi:M48 family metalloprotease [Holophaga foetida]|uniref:M48 family metalloprotease n=1 Tax=Holophaga foetida TaxID=35839 RepID=UPI00024717C8|nr:M48 family metalloprotease [Holophaga foetida]
MNWTASVTIAWVLFATQGAFAIDFGKMVGAGADAVKSVSMSDQDVKAVASAAKTEYDKLNEVASPKDKYGVRLARITKGMKVDKSLDLDIKVYLVKDVNAFAMADGTVRVFAGLMNVMTDDEIRYVIGHEIGHVSLGHSKKALQTAYATSAARKGAAASGNQAAGALSESALGDLAEKLVHSQFSQSQELDADMFALKFMTANSYDPKAAVSALRKLQTMFGNDKSVFSSHPAPGERAKALEKAL